MAPGGVVAVFRPFPNPLGGGQQSCSESVGHGSPNRNPCKGWLNCNGTFHLLFLVVHLWFKCLVFCEVPSERPPNKGMGVNLKGVPLRSCLSGKTQKKTRQRLEHVSLFRHIPAYHTRRYPFKTTSSIYIP